MLSLDMIFIDEKDNMMHATIRKNQVSRYRHILREGNIFAVKNFKVVTSTGQYQPISGEYRIFFLMFTTVKRLDDASTNIARYGFQFLDYQTLESRTNDNRVLSDVIGRLSAIGDIEVVGFGRKKRDIEIVIEQSMSMRITLWGKLAEKFDSSLYLKENGPFIVIVTSTTVKKFKGEIVFSSTGATQIYTNVEVPQVKALRERFSGVENGVEILEKQQSKEVPISKQLFFNRMTVKQLLDREWDPNVEEEFVTVRATITDIDTHFGWSYVSCNVCSKKLVNGDGFYMCETCNKECKFPLVKYKIHLRVADKTGSTTFVMFNMDAEKIVGHFSLQTA